MLNKQIYSNNTKYDHVFLVFNWGGLSQCLSRCLSVIKLTEVKYMHNKAR